MSLPTAALAEAIELPEAIYQPDGRWRLGESETLCWLRRDFVREDDTIAFVVQLADPGTYPQWSLFGQNVGGILRPVTAGFTPGTGTMKFTSLAHASLGDMPGLAFVGRVFPWPLDEKASAEEIGTYLGQGKERLDQVTHYVISGATPQPIALHTRAIGKGMSALKECAERKRAALGLDPHEHKKYTRHAAPLEQEEWAKKIQEDYPKEALKSYFDGTLPIRMIIGPEGKPLHCHVLNDLAARVLRESACGNMLKYSRWTPALDSQGKPAIDSYYTTIQYQLNAQYSTDAHGFRIDPDN